MEGTEGDEEGAVAVAVAVAVAGSSLPRPERRLGQSSGGGGGHRTTVGCCRRSWGHRGLAFVLCGWVGGGIWGGGIPYGRVDEYLG